MSQDQSTGVPPLTVMLVSVNPAGSHRNSMGQATAALPSGRTERAIRNTAAAVSGRRMADTVSNSPGVGFHSTVAR